MARFGELYRLGGAINGQRILPAQWIARSWTSCTVSPGSGQQYGYGWFLAEMAGHPVRFAWGYGGQMIYVIPGLALTIVMTSQADGDRDTGHAGSLHRLVAQGIIAAAEKGGPV